MAKPSGRPIRAELIDIATAMIRRNGVKGFSYGDLARELEIKAPSIHHHFRSKEDLVAEVAAHYREHFANEVEAISASSVLDRLRHYAALFTIGGEDDELCLCGAVAADWRAAGDASRRQVDGFFADQRAWLETQIVDGMSHGEIRSDISAPDLADTVLAALEGAMLLGRANGDRDMAARVGALITGLVSP